MSSEPDWLTLEGGEEIVWSGRPHTWSIARTVTVAVVRTAVLVGAVVTVMGGHLAAVLPEGAPAIESLLPGYALPAAAAVAVLWGLAEAGWAYLRIANVDYVLTDRNLYKKTGVASEYVTRVGLDRIQRTSQSKDVLGRLFDYGSIAVSTAGSSGVEMVIADLNDPDELRTELRRRVNETGSAAPADGLDGGATPEPGD